MIGAGAKMKSEARQVGMTGTGAPGMSGTGARGMSVAGWIVTAAAAVALLAVGCSKKSSDEQSPGAGKAPGVEGATGSAAKGPGSGGDSGGAGSPEATAGSGPATGAGPAGAGDTGGSKPGLEKPAVPPRRIPGPREIVQGPPSPPVVKQEGFQAGELMEWKKVEHVRPSDASGQFPTPLDAALDPDKENNRGAMLYALVRDADMETLERKYLPPAADLSEFLRYVGNTYTQDLVAGHASKISEQVLKLGPQYGEMLGATSRLDRIYGQYRLSKWTFEYLDKGGSKKEGCYLFILADMTWKILDMECAEWFQK